MAKPVQYVTQTTVFEITCHTYGTICKPTKLFEDNSYSNDYNNGQFNWLTLQWNGKEGKYSKKGNYTGSNYKIVDWKSHL